MTRQRLAGRMLGEIKSAKSRNSETALSAALGESIEPPCRLPSLNRDVRLIVSADVFLRGAEDAVAFELLEPMCQPA